MPSYPHQPASEQATAHGLSGPQTLPGAGADPGPTYGGKPANPASPPMAHRVLAPGEVVAGCFRIERQLGAGGMGIVYLATHLQLERLVALKVHHTESPEDKARLEREAKAMARVSHPSVIGVYDVRMDHGVLFIAMEFIDGGNGRDWLADRRHSLEERVKMVLEAARGLAVAHQAGLVHRDFKPENILVSRQGRVVVADFGLARSPGAVQPGAVGPFPVPSVNVQLTEAGALVGTPAYMAPEQYAPGPVDARADQFALAVVTFEAAYGVRPFPGKTPAELAYQVMNGAVLPRPEGSDAPPKLYDVLVRALAPDPGARFPSVSAFSSAAGSALRAPKRSAIILAVVALLVAVVLLSVAGVVGYGRYDEQRGRAVLAKNFQGIGLADSLIAVSEEMLAQAQVAHTEAKKDVRAADAIDRLRKGDSMFDDPEAFSSDLLDAVENEAALGSLLGALMQNQKNAEKARAKAPFSRIPWDGEKTLSCGRGQRILLDGVVADVASGPAIEVAMGCSIKIVDCRIRAETIVHGTMPELVHIEGGELQPTKHLVDVTMGKSVTIKGVELAEPTEGAAVKLGMRTVGRIDDSVLLGSPALEVDMHASLEIFGGRLEGDPIAIAANVGAKVSLSGTTVKGSTEAAANAVVDVVRAP